MSLCDYSAAEKGHLKYHISAKHDGEKPFECNFCDAKFPAKGSRNKHLKDVHKIENVPKYPVETNTHDPSEILDFKFALIYFLCYIEFI